MAIVTTQPAPFGKILDAIGTWLIGRRLREIEKKDYTWFFRFDRFDNCNIGTVSLWRLITSEKIIVSSEDHGHPFGLPAPFDAVQRALAAIGDKSVEQIEIDEKTGDLSLFFEQTIVLQFLQISTGYDSWRIMRESQEVICLGGGTLTTLNINAH